MRTASTLIRDRTFSEITGHTLILPGVHLGYRPFGNVMYFLICYFQDYAFYQQVSSENKAAVLVRCPERQLDSCAIVSTLLLTEQIWAQNYNAS